MDYRDQYQPGARRFDAGERTKFELVPMAIAALEQICAWTVPRVAAALAARTSEIARRAARLGLDPLPGPQRGPHMLGIPLPGPARSRVIGALTDVSCFAALRGASLRISPHLHITDQDIDRLLAGLATAIG